LLSDQGDGKEKQRMHCKNLQCRDVMTFRSFQTLHCIFVVYSAGRTMHQSMNTVRLA